MDTLAVRLQELRKEKALSQEQLAEKLGVSRQAVSKWESEQANPDINNIILLSETFNVTTDYLLKGEKSPMNNSPSNQNPKSTLSKAIDILLVVFASISIAGLLYLLFLYCITRIF